MPPVCWSLGFGQSPPSPPTVLNVGDLRIPALLMVFTVTEQPNSLTAIMPMGVCTPAPPPTPTPPPEKET